MRVVSATCAVFMLVVAVVVVLASQGNPYWDNYAPGPSFMPYWTSAFGAVVACVLLVSAWRLPADTDRLDFSDFGMAGTIIVLLFLYLFLMPWLGMLCGGALLMLVILVGLLRRPFSYSLLTVGVTTLLLYGIFDVWLRLGLPKSVIGI